MNLTSMAVDREPNKISRSRRFFPGWTMVGMAAAAQFMSAPGQSYSVAAFKEPMRTSLGLSETNYSLAYAFATIVSGMLLPLVGRMIDRHGARTMMPAIAFLLGTACLGMSRVSGLGGLYLGFSFVRSLGQGALSLVAAWLVCEWFARRRGFATALSGLGGSLSVMTIPLGNAWLINHYGWQTGWIALAFGVWGLLFLPSLFLVRDRPEALGWSPDGDEYVGHPPVSPRGGEQTPDASGPNRDWAVSHVVRDSTFWKLLAVPATSGMVGTGLIFHAVSLLGSRGVSPGGALGLISLQAIVATCAALVAGWMTDRFQARYLLSAAMLLLALSGTIVLVMPFPIVAVLYAIVLGLHGSILRSTGVVVWINYYGRENQGAIRGLAMAVMIFAAAIGPLPLALSVDWFGTYDIALCGFIAAPLAAAVIVWTAGPPRNRPGLQPKTLQ